MNIAKAKENILKIVGYIKDGMSEVDSLILSEVSQDDYLEISKKFPKVAELVGRAKIEYKYRIISKMTSAANAGDTKAMNWLAENSTVFQNDFGKKKGGPDPVNPLTEAFKFIQNNSKPPVKKGGKQI